MFLTFKRKNGQFWDFSWKPQTGCSLRNLLPFRRLQALGDIHFYWYTHLFMTLIIESLFLDHSCFNSGFALLSVFFNLLSSLCPKSQILSLLPCTFFSLIVFFCYSHFFIHSVSSHCNIVLIWPRFKFLLTFLLFPSVLFLTSYLFLPFLQQGSLQSAPFVSPFLSFIPALQLILWSLLCS